MELCLRQLPDGTRFMLCRTRKMYRLVSRVREKGRTRIIVQQEGYAGESSLHHSCRVKPVQGKGIHMTNSSTPRADRLDTLRIEMGQQRSPAYGDALRLCRNLEAQVARLTTALAQANTEASKYAQLANRVATLEATLTESVAWMDDCVTDVLYPLAHQNTQLGVAAEGFGAASVAIVTKAKALLTPDTTA